jgi:hypothetical protein
MFVYESGLLQPSDYIITSNADIFPVSASILLTPARERNQAGEFYRLWIAQYVIGMKGQNIPMVFLGQSITDWQTSMELANLDFKKATAESQISPTAWFADQDLATVAIANKQLRIVPKNHRIRERMNHLILQDHREEMDDHMTCLKGGSGNYRMQGYAQCLSKLKGKVCTYVHVLPQDTVETIMTAYDDIATRFPGYVASRELLKLEAAERWD